MVRFFSKCRSIPRRRWRNLISFWCFGLGNNFSYVIMLSAALDIIKKQEHSGPELQLRKYHTNCTETGTGSVLLADILPSMGIKILAPLFIHQLHFHFKILLSCALALNSFILVSFSPSMAVSLLGIVSASFSCGIGDVSYLSMTAFFHRDCVSAWSSGTGAAGLVGALAYASLTTSTSPETALLILTVVPISMVLVYFCLLNRPDHPKFRVSFACCRSNATRSSLLTERISHYNSLNSPEDRFGADTGSHSQPSRCDVSIHPNKEYEVHIREVVPNTEIWDTCSVSSESALAPDAGTHQDAVSLEQIHPSWSVKWLIFRSLAGLLIYLSLVYFFEYLINQSLFELLHFENSIPDTQQYRWYQVLYQTGVFFSRSSVNLVQLRRTWIMAILQAGNFALCLTQVIYQYIPSIWIMCVIILYEGCLGGLAYVNTFYRIIQETAPAYREYAMSFATIADSIGITVAGFLAIPLHHWLCTVLR